MYIYSNNIILDKWNKCVNRLLIVFLIFIYLSFFFIPVINFFAFAIINNMQIKSFVFINIKNYYHIYFDTCIWFVYRLIACVVRKIFCVQKLSDFKFLVFLQLLKMCRIIIIYKIYFDTCYRLIDKIFLFDM